MGAAGHPSSCSTSSSKPTSERRQWQRIFAAALEMIRRRQGQIETLAGDRKFHQEYINLQHRVWSSKTRLLQSQISQVIREEDVGRRVQAAKLDLFVGSKQKEALCYKELLEIAESDLDDFCECAETLNKQISGLKEKLEGRTSKETEDGMREPCDLAATQNRNEEEHYSSGLGEVRKWKQAYKKLSSEKGAVISSLLAEKDSVWHQLKKMDSDYAGCLKSKKIEIEQAIEAVEKLKAVVEKLQSSATDKDERIVKLKADLSRVQLALGSHTREVQVSREEIEKLRVDKKNLNSLVTEKDEMIAKLQRELAKHDVGMNLYNNRKTRLSNNSSSLTKSRGHSATRAGRYQEGAVSRSSYVIRKHSQVYNDTSGPQTADMASKRCSKRKSVASIFTQDSPKLFAASFKVPKLQS